MKTERLRKNWRMILFVAGIVFGYALLVYAWLRQAGKLP